MHSCTEYSASAGFTRFSHRLSTAVIVERTNHVRSNSFINYIKKIRDVNEKISYKKNFMKNFIKKRFHKNKESLKKYIPTLCADNKYIT